MRNHRATPRVNKLGSFQTRNEKYGVLDAPCLTCITQRPDKGKKA